MNTELLFALMRCETDVDGALGRLSGDEALYLSCLDAFLTDPTMDELERTIKEREWDEAFTAAHALKGMAGNMGFVPLFHAAGELVINIRAGRINEVGSSCQKVRECYGRLTSAVCAHLHAAANGEDGDDE